MNSGHSMFTLHSMALAAVALVASPVFASAQEIAHAPIPAADSPQTTDQVIYKGLVGNVLDNLPMDPVQRMSLQRTNAVVGSAFSGRSLGALAGIGGPALMIVGLAWGMWAASNIAPLAADKQPMPVNTDAEAATKTVLASSSDYRPAARNLDATADSRINATIMTAYLAASDAPHTRVIRVWLPQRRDEPQGWSNYR